MPTRFMLYRRNRLILVAVFFVCCFCLSGCKHVLHPYNQPSQEKVCIRSEARQQYTIEVADKSVYQVPLNGRVVVEVPRLQRGCATYLFGILKVSDSSSYDAVAIRLKKDGRSVRELSLNDLLKLPVDEAGYRVITVK